MSKVTEILKSTKEKNHVEYEKLPIESYEGSYSECAISHSFVTDLFRKLMGKTLTIVDASISDKQQNKAIKDLVRGAYMEEIEFVNSMVYNQDELNEAADEATKDLDPNDSFEVSIEEALGVEQ